MYEVINKENGERIAIVEQPRYVRLKESSGAFIQCSKDEAEGVAVNGELYSLNNKLEGKPEAAINELDGGTFAQAAQQHDQELLHIKAALCDLDLEAGE